MMKYELVINWSEPDKAFIAEVPELPGCAADGATYEKVVKNVQRVIAEWIETARELGRDIPEPRGRLMFARSLRTLGEGRNATTRRIASDL